MDALFDLAPPAKCICVPFSGVRVEPWCPVHDPSGTVVIAPELRLRDETGKPLPTVN